jgi:hypothetical protein
MRVLHVLQQFYLCVKPFFITQMALVFSLQFPQLLFCQVRLAVTILVDNLVTVNFLIVDYPVMYDQMIGKTLLALNGVGAIRFGTQKWIESFVNETVLEQTIGRDKCLETHLTHLHLVIVTNLDVLVQSGFRLEFL